MSDHASGPAPVPSDEYPVSAGIPTGVRVALLLGVGLIISILGMTIGASSFGHVWPSADSLQIPL
jgi:hypothetical protein